MLDFLLSGVGATTSQLDCCIFLRPLFTPRNFSLLLLLAHTVRMFRQSSWLAGSGARGREGPIAKREKCTGHTTPKEKTGFGTTAKEEGQEGEGGKECRGYKSGAGSADQIESVSRFELKQSSDKHKHHHGDGKGAATHTHTFLYM